MSKRSAEEENVCSFFLERKKRLCRMKTANGMNFCPHHSHLGSDLNEKKGARIPCPLDSSHFCYESKLQKHLKKCNAREKEKPAYFIQNINAPDFNTSENNKLSLIDVPDEELLCLVEKVKTLYNDTELHIHDSFTMHPILQAEMQNVDDGLCSFKHMKQQASLLALLENCNLLADGTCFLEFGAGKGQLMYWIIKCVPDTQKAAFILVDKSAQRHKSDNKFKGSDLLIQRIRIDIQHLHIGRIENIAENLNKVVGVSKHLCGAATDLALKCLMDTLEVEQNEEKLKHKALGMVMALCCHHRCTWSTYIGKEFMKEHGISERDFKIMCCIASWATCGLRKTDKSENPPSEDHCENLQDDKLLNRYIKLNLTHEEREKIGLQSKRLIDAGRVNFLQKQGYDVQIINYVDKSVSLENAALVALYKGK